jgi:hypothetical protein
VVHNEALKKYITARLIKMLSRLLATLVPTQKEKKKKKKKKKKNKIGRQKYASGCCTVN